MKSIRTLSHKQTLTMRIPVFITLLLSALSMQAKTESIPDIPDELSLETSIQFAMASNPSILNAKERIKEQEGRTLEVHSTRLPTINASANYYRQDNQGQFASIYDEDWAASLGLRQNIYGGGAIGAAIKRQDASETAALYDVQATINSVILSVKTAFYDILLARDTIKVEEENIQLLEEQLRQMNNRFEAGTVSNFDVLQIKVALANAKPDLIRSKTNLRIAMDEFRRIMGYSKNDVSNIKKKPNFVGNLISKPVDYGLEESLFVAAQRRPEIRQLEQQIKAASQEIRVQNAGTRPDLDFVANYNYRRSSMADDQFSDPDKSWYMGLEVSWDIFDGKRTQGKVFQARSSKRQLELQLKETELAIEVEVRRALSDLIQAKELVSAAEQVVEQAEEALRLATERNRAGAATYLDLMQARVSLIDAKNNALNSHYAYLIAEASLEAATGTSAYIATEQ